MEVLDNSECFVCGQGNPVGLKAVFEIDRGRRTARSRVIIPKQFQGWQSIVHGGVVTSLLDEAAIYVCRTLGEQFVTAEISVKFKKPVPVECEIEVRGELIKQNRRILHVQSWLEWDGEVLAEAASKVFAIR